METLGTILVIIILVAWALFLDISIWYLNSEQGKKDAWKNLEENW